MNRRDGLSSPPRTPNQSDDDAGMTQDLSPIYREFDVSCSVEQAFDTWTRRIGLWWPLAGHSVSHEDAASVRIEPVLGGRIIETTRTGKEIVWGTVNQWQPPSKFGYFWHIGEEGAAEATEVTITFTALDVERTRVTITHGGWERAGSARGPKRHANERGWDGVILALTGFISGSGSSKGKPFPPLEGG